MAPRCPFSFDYLSESEIRHRGNTNLCVNKDFLNVLYAFLFLSFNIWLASSIKNFTSFLGLLRNNLFIYFWVIRTLTPISIIKKKKEMHWSIKKLFCFREVFVLLETNGREYSEMYGYNIAVVYVQHQYKVIYFLKYIFLLKLMEEFQAKTQLLLIKGNNSLNIVRGDKKNSVWKCFH